MPPPDATARPPRRSLGRGVAGAGGPRPAGPDGRAAEAASGPHAGTDAEGLAPDPGREPAPTTEDVLVPVAPTGAGEAASGTGRAVRGTDGGSRGVVGPAGPTEQADRLAGRPPAVPEQGAFGGKPVATDSEAAGPESVGGAVPARPDRPPEPAGPEAAAAFPTPLPEAPRASGAALPFPGPAAPRPGEALRAGAAGEPGAAAEGSVFAAEAETADQPAGPDPAGEAGGRFTVRLANFEGPFDLLLQLISRHKMDVTEVALSKVTDEFMAHIHQMGPDWDLDQATEFLVVAATLLDLKAARLLPAAEVEDEEDLALLEARDLLFARLLQYRAYKRVAAIFADRLEAEARHRPRTVGLEPQHAELLPEVVLSIGPERFARLAVKAMQPKPKPRVYVDHIHAPLVSVREQAEQMIAVLRERGAASFGDLTADAPDTLTVVARFLALLELYREKAVALDQEEALGALQVRWTGGEDDGAQPRVTDEFDRETGPGKPGKPEKPGDPGKRQETGAE